MNKKKGFTLAELLIVVAIIAVLVGIAIPVFTSQLEKAKEGTDLANIRSAYAEAQTLLVANGIDEATIWTDAKMVSKDEIDKVDPSTSIGGVAVSTLGKIQQGKYCSVKVLKDGTMSLGFADTKGTDTAE